MVGVSRRLTRGRQENVIAGGQHQLRLSLPRQRHLGDLSDFACLVRGPEGNNFFAQKFVAQAAGPLAIFDFPRQFQPQSPVFLPAGRYRVEWTAIEHLKGKADRGRRIVIARDRFFVSGSGTFADQARVLIRPWLAAKAKWIIGLFIVAAIGTMGTLFAEEFLPFGENSPEQSPESALVPAQTPSPPLSISPTPERARTREVRETEVVLYRPVTAEGRINPSFEIGHHRRGFGHCPYGALGNPGNPDTWRCFGTTVGNRGNPRSLILDPCWELFRTPTAVICPESPWSTGATVLRLVSELANEEQNVRSQKEPWALRLANGEKCLHRAGGTAFLVAGTPPTYFCKEGEIIGRLDRQKAVWKAFYSSLDSTEVREVAVAKAWL